VARFLSTLLLFIYSVAAFAADKADAPVEKADPMVVVGFLVLFFGSCAGYVAYLLYTKRKEAKGSPEGKVDPT
jgi:hypothetical protein